MADIPKEKTKDWRGSLPGPQQRNQKNTCHKLALKILWKNAFAIAASFSSFQLDSSLASCQT